MNEKSETSQVVVNKLSYDGKTSQVFGLWLKNIFLTIITLGIYRFWGKTEMRKYLVGRFELNGDRFEYTGRGIELFRGFLIFVPFIVISSFFLFFFFGRDGIDFLFVVIILFIIPMAIYGALRYRLSRTTWRGVRGRLVGSAVKYAALNVGYFILTLLTFGLIVPYWDMKLYQYVAENTYFGDSKVSFNFSTKGLMKLHLLTLLLFPFTLSLSRCWYKAALMRHQCANVTIDGLRLRCVASGGDLALLKIGNYFITIFTLGLGASWIIQRHMNFIAANISVIGDLEKIKFVQAKGKLAMSGEGLADGLGVDVGIL